MGIQKETVETDGQEVTLVRYEDAGTLQSGKYWMINGRAILTSNEVRFLDLWQEQRPGEELKQDEIAKLLQQIGISNSVLYKQLLEKGLVIQTGSRYRSGYRVKQRLKWRVKDEATRQSIQRAYYRLYRRKKKAGSKGSDASA